MAAAPLKDRIRSEYQQLLDNFANLVRSARFSDDAGEATSKQGRVPGELMEVFAEKMLQACHTLLGVVAELKRNALLNDVAGRNAEVSSSCMATAAEVAELERRFQQLQQRIDGALQLLPTSDQEMEQAAEAGQQQQQPPQGEQLAMEQAAMAGT